MKKLRRALLVLGPWLAWALAAPAAEPNPPPGSITFEGKNVISTAHGSFRSWRIVRAEVDPAQPKNGVVEVEVDVASLETGIERRDNHLRTADFFDAEKFPKATVRVRGAEPAGKSERGTLRYRAKFDVTIRGVSKTLDGEFELVSDAPPTVEGDLTLNRVDFGIGEPFTWYVPGSIEEAVPVHFRALLPARR